METEKTKKNRKLPSNVFNLGRKIWLAGIGFRKVSRDAWNAYWDDMIERDEFLAITGVLGFEAVTETKVAENATK